MSSECEFQLYFSMQITFYIIEISQSNKNTNKSSGIGILPVSKRLILKVTSSKHFYLNLHNPCLIIIFASRLFRSSWRFWSLFTNFKMPKILFVGWITCCVTWKTRLYQPFWSWHLFDSETTMTSLKLNWNILKRHYRIMLIFSLSPLISRRKNKKNNT